jgi:histidinol phosphatase-like PHP family hydrolase
MHMRGFVMQDPPEIIAARKELKSKFAQQFPEIEEKKINSMAGVFAEADLAGKVENYNPVPYYANFMVDSFKGLMENEEFIKIAKAVPTSIAHPFHPCGFSEDMRTKIIREVSDDDYRECFKMAKKLGVAMEINTASFTRVDNDYANEEHIHTFRLAKEIGVKFTFGTDTHSLIGLDKIRKGDRISELIGITESDLMDYVK